VARGVFGGEMHFERNGAALCPPARDAVSVYVEGTFELPRSAPTTSFSVEPSQVTEFTGIALGDWSILYIAAFHPPPSAFAIRTTMPNSPLLALSFPCQSPRNVIPHVLVPNFRSVWNTDVRIEESVLRAW
jgi:hypothetical protein